MTGIPGFYVLLIIAIGYSISNYLPLQYRMAQLSGYRQYGAIILYGLCCLLAVAALMYSCCVLFVSIGYRISLGGMRFESFVAEYMFDISIASLALAFSVPYLLNKSYYRDDERKRGIFYKVSIKSRNELDICLLESAMLYKPLLLVLDTGKVYYGYVEKTPNPLDDKEAQYLGILPFASGYRDEKLRVVFTKDYLSALADEADTTSPELGNIENFMEFVKIIPIRSIKSANFFDMEKYRESLAHRPTDTGGRVV